MRPQNNSSVVRPSRILVVCNTGRDIYLDTPPPSNWGQCVSRGTTPGSHEEKVIIPCYCYSKTVYTHLVQTVIFPNPDPNPNYDHCGYEVACKFLLHSMRGEKHDDSCTKFETIRKLRSVYNNHCRAIPKSNVNHHAMVDYKDRYTCLCDDKD